MDYIFESYRKDDKIEVNHDWHDSIDEINSEMKLNEYSKIDKKLEINQLEYIQKLKNRWNQGMYWLEQGGGQHDILDTKGGHGQVITEQLKYLGDVEESGEELMKDKFYVTDRIGYYQGIVEAEKRSDPDPRELQDGNEIISRTSFIRREFNNLRNQKVKNRINDLLDEYLNFIKDKNIYTRRGLAAIDDLINDNFLTKHILEQRSAKILIEQIKSNEKLQSFLEKNPLSNEEGEDNALVLGQWLGLLPDDYRQRIESDYKKIEGENASDYVALAMASEVVVNNNEFRPLTKEQQLRDLPLELQIVVKEYPEAASSIMRLMSSDAEVCLKTCQQTYPDVTAAIHEVSVISQHNFQTNWLRNLVTDNKEPNLNIGNNIIRLKTEVIPNLQKEIRELSVKIAEIEKRKSKIKVVREIYEEDTQAQLELPRLREEIKKKERQIEYCQKRLSLTEKVDLKGDVDYIAKAALGYKEVVALHPERLKLQDKEAIVELNNFLEKISREYAAHRMQFDVSDEQTETAQSIMKALMFIGPVAHQLENLDLGVVAKLFTSSADDLMGEFGEIKALLGAGFSKQELMKRLKVAVPVFGVATFGAHEVERLLQSGQDLTAGAIFGASAVALSFTTAIQSMKMYKNNFEELLREGKISGFSLLATHPEFKKRWQEFSAGIDELDKTDLIAKVESTLKDTTISDTERNFIVNQLHQLDEKEINKILNRSANKEAWLQAIKQDFNNPVRLGILIGSALAPAVGLAGGAAGLLHNGFVLAGIGSTESIIAGGIVIVARKLNDYKWQMKLAQQLGYSKFEHLDKKIRARLEEIEDKVKRVKLEKPEELIPEELAA